MTEPQTEAGRALVDMPMRTAGIGSDRDDDRLREAVIAIEREAAALAAERAAPKVERPRNRSITAGTSRRPSFGTGMNHESPERAAPKVDALDVERLAKAAHLASGFSLGTFDDSDCGDRIYAEAVAAEYARLAEKERP